MPLITQAGSAAVLADALSFAGGALSLRDGPGGRSTPFSGVSFYEPDDHRSLQGQLVLCPGVADPHDVERIRQELADRSAAGIVVRPGGVDGRTERVDTVAPWVLHLAPGADWADLAASLRALCDPVAHDYGASAALGDLFAAANALAARIGGAVCFVDPFGRVIGYSTLNDQPLDDVRRSTTLSLREALPIAEDDEHAVLLRAASAVFLEPQPGQFGRVARAVRSGAELLGTIWVVCVDPDDSARMTTVLDAVEPVISQHFRRARDESDRADVRRRTLLDALLDPATAPLAAARKGLPSRGGHVAVSFGIAGDGHSADAYRRLLNLVLSTSSTWFAYSQAALVEDRVLLVVSAAARDRIRSHAEFVAQTDPDIVVGIGSLVDEPAAIWRSSGEASATADHATASRDAGQVAYFSDVRDSIALARIGRRLQSIDLPSDDAFDRLKSHDHGDPAPLWPTVLAYLEEGNSISATAARLHVHGNTVRYRLARVREDLGIELDQPATRLLLWLRLVCTPVEADAPTTRRTPAQ